MYSQDEENIYVMLDDNSLFQLSESEGLVTLKIPFFKYKDEWLNVPTDGKNNSGDDIVVVDSQPTSSKIFEFNSLSKPIKLADLKNIKWFKVEDVSRELKSVFKSYPYKMHFIKRNKCNEFLVWKMHLKINE